MSEQPDRWMRRASKQIADCRVFKVREDSCERESDGAKQNFFVVESPDWVNIIALTKDERVVLIEQYRQGTEEITLEIPGGMVDENEPAETAARRELTEETGYASSKFILLGKSRPNPAIQANWMYHFLALGCEQTQETAFDEHESIVTKTVSLEEIKNLIKSEEITHSLVLAAFLRFSLYREKINL